jgi:hypothetical protein
VKKFKTLVLLILIFSFKLNSQEIKNSWLFNNQEAFVTENNGIVTSDIFDFFSDYTKSNDTLKIKHVYPETECSIYENGKKIVIPCPDNSMPDSWFRITKLTSDSLFLRPINRSAIAISARLKNRLHEQSKKIISDSNYTPDYYKIIKLYNPKTLFKEIEWSKIRISSKSIGWFQEHYDYLEINNNGTFKAFKKIKPFEEGKPSVEYIEKITFYEDALTAVELNELNQDLNNSGFLQFNIDSQGWSSHGSLIKIQVFDDKKSKTHLGYIHKYPKFTLPLIKRLLSLVSEEVTKQSKKQFEIPVDFKINDE